VYIGRSQADAQRPIVIQVGDKIVDIEDLPDYIREERKRMSPEEAREMTVAIRADKDTPMGVVTEVKQALRRANALRVSYAAEEVKPKN
jgi:biopolymer transport protein ExbD